ncbi:MAG: orotidine-5'-phosphate decarboxylase [Flavobacteriales bacterium]|nr:orotidine-5'-phosphate decarboxylase [Bacteroidota bacterium]MCB9240456.1 orotidine-5'-phosphate decarboxylase [Flavobacteriales bacterium]
MNIQQLRSAIQAKGSYLCVGLDSDLHKIPSHLNNEPNALLEFNRQIIEATSPYAVAYKINTAFYEQYGTDGWNIMAETLKLIPTDCFSIADAKRGDIGNTGEMYARAFFDELNFDSITVSPYMGKDSVQPFMRADKTVIVLGLTSNPGSADFQYLQADGMPLYEHVLRKTSEWGSPENLMFVVGATRAERLDHIRSIVPEHFLLVPGVGAQGGSLEDVSKHGLINGGGLLVNSSRGIIYASSDLQFAQAAANEAKKLQQVMATYL